MNSRLRATLQQVALDPVLTPFLKQYCTDYKDASAAVEILPKEDAGLVNFYLVSFQPFVTQLKTKDETLFAEPRCLFVRFIGLDHNWASFSEEMKHAC
jgi:hypothetical protein